MRIPSLLTALVLIGFALACGGSTEVEDDPAPVHVEEPGEPEVIEEPGDAHAGDPMSHYASSAFDYCDAKVLGALWGESPFEAKASIGQMLMDGEKSFLEEKLTGCQQRALEDLENRDIRCHYDDLGVSYDDAVALASFWGVDTWDAKMRVEEKYLRDGHDDQYVRAAIREAHAAAGPGH